MALENISKENIPNHIACVMDGNGRWAKQRGLKRTDGHTAGEEALSRVVEAADDLGVDWLTVYAFSTENWKRPKTEVTFLMRLFDENLLLKRRDDLHAKNVRVRFIGRPDWRIPKKLVRGIKETEEMTANNTGMTFTVAFNYGSQAEIVDAVRKITEKGIAANSIDEKTIAQHLYDPEMPEVDLWVRTSGEYRISNFMLWQASYAEMVFLDTFWPDMCDQDLHNAIIEYQERTRRFGGL